MLSLDEFLEKKAVGTWKLHVEHAGVDGSPDSRLLFFHEATLVVRVPGEPPPPEPAIEVSPRCRDFPATDIGMSSSATFSISNLGESDLLVTDIFFEVGSSGEYALDSAPTLPFVLPPLASDPVAGTTQVEAVYSPTADGSGSAVLQIESDDPDDGLVTVGLGALPPVISATAAIDLTSGTSGSISVNSTFNETRGVDITVGGQMSYNVMGT